MTLARWCPVPSCVSSRRPKNTTPPYTFAGIAPGDYTLQASAPGLAMAKALKISVKPGLQTVNLQLKIATITEKVTVNESTGATVNADPSNNASALVLRGDDLDALSDDPTSLEEDLLALAGPAAGPNGGSIFVDGFSGGQIPSKDSIREIRRSKVVIIRPDGVRISFFDPATGLGHPTPVRGFGNNRHGQSRHGQQQRRGIELPLAYQRGEIFAHLVKHVRSGEHFRDFRVGQHQPRTAANERRQQDVSVRRETHGASSSSRQSLSIRHPRKPATS